MRNLTCRILWMLIQIFIFRLYLANRFATAGRRQITPYLKFASKWFLIVSHCSLWGCLTNHRWLFYVSRITLRQCGVAACFSNDPRSTRKLSSCFSLFIPAHLVCAELPGCIQPFCCAHLLEVWWLYALPQREEAGTDKPHLKDWLTKSSTLGSVLVWRYESINVKRIYR